MDILLLGKIQCFGVNEPCKSCMLSNSVTSIKEFGCVSRHKSKTDFAFFCSNETQMKIWIPHSEKIHFR